MPLSSTISKQRWKLKSLTSVASGKPAGKGTPSDLNWVSPSRIRESFIIFVPLRLNQLCGNPPPLIHATLMTFSRSPSLSTDSPRRRTYERGIGLHRGDISGHVWIKEMHQPITSKHNRSDDSLRCLYAQNQDVFSSSERLRQYSISSPLPYKCNNQGIRIWIENMEFCKCVTTICGSSIIKLMIYHFDHHGD